MSRKMHGQKAGEIIALREDGEVLLPVGKDPIGGPIPVSEIIEYRQTLVRAILSREDREKSRRKHLPHSNTMIGRNNDVER